MTPSELKYHVEARGDEPHFFDRATLKFFGDTMRNYGVRKASLIDGSGTLLGGTLGSIECWELYRKHPVKHGLRSSHFFATDDFRTIHSKD